MDYNDVWGKVDTGEVEGRTWFWCRTTILRRNQRMVKYWIVQTQAETLTLGDKTPDLRKNFYKNRVTNCIELESWLNLKRQL